MNDLKFRYILYVIVVVIISTIGIQWYWNYKNYLNSKQQLINDVNLSLDKAIDDYYAELAEKTTLGLKLEGNAQKNVLNEGGFLEEISKSIDESHGIFINLDSIKSKDIKGVTIISGLEADSMMNDTKKDNKNLYPDEFNNKINRLKANDSLDIDVSNFELLTSKIVISISNDSLDINKVDSLLKADLKRKKIDIDYKLNFRESKTDSLSENFYQNNKTSDFQILSYTSKSTFLPKNSTLSIFFKNIKRAVFNRIFISMLISTLLVLAVISCLFYLLKIIKNQKQLAEVKNDLISNITHEFKTPIATIGVALESISNFNVIDDKEKTKTYIDLSSNQLSKLTTMVEKLLETASLDSESLELNKENINLVTLLETLVNRYELQHPHKNFKTHMVNENSVVHIDPFHFENALNNILDNAVKYGGNDITVELFSKLNKVNISISDNGNTISKENKHRVFEKFYRIPKGNTHDVKGFGIGLYYTKSIIEKHGGSIELNLKNELTTFKITVPNG